MAKKSSPGRPSKVMKLQKRAIIRSACNSTKSARGFCEERRHIITAGRVRQILSQSGKGKAAKMLRKLGCRLRIFRADFSSPFLMSWVNEWKKVIFSDEKRFNKYDPNG